MIVMCGTVPDNDSECRAVLDSTSEHDMYSMGTIVNYDLSDVTMTNYAKFLILLMWVILIFHCSRLSPLNFCSSDSIVREGISDDIVAVLVFVVGFFTYRLIKNYAATGPITFRK